MFDALRRVRWWQWLLMALVTLLIIGAISRGGDQGQGGAAPVTAPSPSGGGPQVDGSGG